MSTKITVIRHGETSWNAVGRWQGNAPVPLNEIGREQARLLALHLAPTASEVTAFYSSDLARACETAQIIAMTLQLSLAVTLDKRLRETDLGDWQGLSHAEIQAWDHERWERIVHDPNSPRPGGESPAQVADRATAALLDYVTRHPDGNVWVVSHGGTIRNMLHRLDLITTDIGNIGNTSTTLILYDPAENPCWRLATLAQNVHLGTPVGRDSREG